jgi:hypothetical protein
MKSWLVVFRVTLSTIALALLASCGGAESEIVGKWKVTGVPNGEVWEFASNKSIDMSGRKGKYTFGDQGRLKVQTRSATFVYQLQIAGDRMVLTDATGARTELERVK